MTDQIIQWNFSQPTPPLHEPPHPNMTHPPLYDPPHPCMTHPTSTWPTPPLHGPHHPYMTLPTPPLHDPPHPTPWPTPPYMTHPTPAWPTHPCMTHPTSAWPTPPLHDPPYPTSAWPTPWPTPTWPTPPLHDPPHHTPAWPTTPHPTCMTHPTLPLHDPPHPIPPLEHFWEEHPWNSWGPSLCLPFGRQKRGKIDVEMFTTAVNGDSFPPYQTSNLDTSLECFMYDNPELNCWNFNNESQWVFLIFHCQRQEVILEQILICKSIRSFTLYSCKDAAPIVWYSHMISCLACWGSDMRIVGDCMLLLNYDLHDFVLHSLLQ